MTHITATSFRNNLYNIINQVNEEHIPVSITNTRGRGAVLIGEDDWANIEETLFLSSIPTVSDSLIEGRNTAIDELVSEKDLAW